MRKVFTKYMGLVAICPLLAACPSKALRDSDKWHSPSKITYKDSFEIIKTAADKGDPHAMYLIGENSLVQKKGNVTQQEANAYLIKSAQNKNYDSQVKVWHIYRTGGGGFPKDYSKAIYWARRMTCDHSFDTAADMYLSDLYGGGNYTAPNNEERALVAPNLPFAYAHLRLAGVVGNALLDPVKTKMSQAQIGEGEKIVELFHNGGCPYDN